MSVHFNHYECISVGKNLIHRRSNIYILEIYIETLNGEDIFETYGLFKHLDNAILTAKRVTKFQSYLRKNN